MNFTERLQLDNIASVQQYTYKVNFNTMLFKKKFSGLVLTLLGIKIKYCWIALY